MGKLKVALRYGKLSNGLRIPCSYALELEDGRSVLYQTDRDWPSLATALGARLALGLREIYDVEAAGRWLDALVDDEFDVDTDDVPEEWFE